LGGWLKKMTFFSYIYILKRKKEKCFLYFFFRNLVEINFFSQFGIIWQKSLEIPLFFYSFFFFKKKYLFIYLCKWDGDFLLPLFKWLSCYQCTRAHQRLQERGMAALYVSILPHFKLLRQAHPHYELLF